MSKPKTPINPIRAERLKILMHEEGLNQTEFADKIGLTQKSITSYVRLRNGLSEPTARDIISIFPKYRLEWLMGYDDYMTHNDFERAYIKNSDIKNDALLAVMDAAWREICAREGLKEVPTLDNIPELLLIQAQLRDYAEALMSGYFHRDSSHVWSYLDSIEGKRKEVK